jgi:hypothetical protein
MALDKALSQTDTHLWLDWNKDKIHVPANKPEP